jgi:DNA-binding MurR/RpiR family transcriptional regulator
VISEHPAQMQSSELGAQLPGNLPGGYRHDEADLDDRAFEKAVTILQNAEHIYIMGVRRMFPVASYLAYALSQTRKRVIMVDGLGGCTRNRSRGSPKAMC